MLSLFQDILHDVLGQMFKPDQVNLRIHCRLLHIQRAVYSALYNSFITVVLSANRAAESNVN